MDRVQSGIPGFDDMIEGGFKRNSNVLVTGGVGVGKSTFCMQYLCTGARIGERGIYITFEEEAEELKDSMSRYNWGIGELEGKGLITIMHLSPQDVLHMIESGYGGIMSAIHTSNAKRVVIDSISSIELMIKDEFKKRENMLHLLSWLRKSNCTTLLVAESEQHPNLYSRHGIIEYCVDGVIVLYNLRRQSVRQRALEVLKMRGIHHTTRVVPFLIGNGIELMPKQKIFGDF
jgi:KaiC/GvpD/RAD55 family RecA-like ATPase